MLLPTHLVHSHSYMLSLPNSMELSLPQQVSTRRKSCFACVKAKRRCDLQTPCYRCQTRGVICNYPRRYTALSVDSGEPLLPIAPPSFESMFDHLGYTFANPLTPTYLFDDLLSPMLVPPRTVYLSKDKLDSLAQHFKGYITSLVQYGHTPFISSRLYEEDLPQNLQDAYLICASYLSKTTTNENMVFSILSSKVNDLLLRSSYCSLEDNLASVQALIMYQIVRLFDGDIRQRSTAESQFPILDTLTRQLKQRNEQELPLSMQSSPYRRWLFVESVRRTTLMALFFQGVYHAFQSGYCDRVPDMAGLPVTVRGNLWEVKSEVEWMLATSGRAPEVMSYYDFSRVWDGFPAEADMEGFQKVLLIACIGEDGLQARFLESLTKDIGWTSDRLDI